VAQARARPAGGTELTLESPLGLLVALAALVPLTALAAAVFRAERVTRVLGLTPGNRRNSIVAASLASAAIVLLALAAAQPALETTTHRSVRTQSQVFYVIDVSRSMAASSAPKANARLVRARAIVARLHAATADVPSGLAGLTDRVLPYLFPTGDDASFAETLRRSVRIESPPPQQVATNATSFGALASLSRDGFFDRSASRRTCVVVTDGETKSYSASTVARALGGDHGCRLVVVRVGGASERVYVGGRAEPGYAPDRAAPAKTRELAEDAGGRSYDETSVAASISALRSDAEAGPVKRAPAEASRRSLSLYAGLLALALVVIVAGWRIGVPGLRLIRTSA
jgi:hypothetical protein